ncbi:hypothetical protein AM588_10010850 [Phytophthora nicotianae]|uniref:EF-hand domain-containing protein n=1 Tax=Phytophthora nicotianae TaxID=4792 RepID=A0A0W8DPJ7_PHYNI|nr:hypothetical protein AM588_10010850 [Phytophthora nicotianae]
MEEAVAANEEAILERRHEIRTSLRAVENSLREAGAVTNGYNSAYWLESTNVHWDGLSSSLFLRQVEHVSKATLARYASHRFNFDAPDPVRYHWRLTPLGKAKCRRIWSLFDADRDDKWTHEEFREYMVGLKCSTDSVELRAFEGSPEIWRMYTSDMCELDEEGKLTFEGFKMYRELVEEDQPLQRDLASLGISLQWEEVEKVTMIKRLFDEYVDDPMGTVTAKAAQYLLAETGILLTSEETIEIIERRYQHARCQRFIHQLKRTLRLFGYRQQSALRFTNEGLPNKTGNNEEQPRICQVGLLSLVFSSWSPALKTSFCALRRLKRRVYWALTCVRQVASTGMLSASCLLSRTPGSDRGDYMLKMDIGPKFATTSTIHITYNSDADSAATLHELKYLERGAECFLYIDLACRSGTKAQWSCRAQMDVRLSRQAWAQIISQVAYHLEAELAHELEDAEYIAQMNAEREQKKDKSLMPNQRSSAPNRDEREVRNPQNPVFAEIKTESRQHMLIKSLRRVANALQHSQQLSSLWSFTNLGSALRENPWFRSVLSPEWFKLLKHVFDTPGGLAEEWKAKGDSLRAEFDDSSYVRAGTRTAHGHHPTSRAAETTKSSEPKLHNGFQQEMKMATHHGHEANQQGTNATESTEEKSEEHLLLEFYDMCARHLQGVHIVHAEAGTSGVTCILEGWNIFGLLPRIHQGHLAKRVSLTRSGTFSSRQPHSR